jgi:hypothetical protein
MTQGIVPHSTTESAGDAVHPPRRCGRCRLLFAGDATVGGATGQPEWWICDACRAVLLPNRPARRLGRDE